jgi:dienelactone hydrolase
VAVGTRTALCQNDSFAKGIIIDTIWCKARSKYSYALFLPSVYDKNKEFPIIFVFDPGANGKSEADLFKDAAEKYGYILVCSNNSKNGPWDEIEKSVDYTIEDALSRFSFNKNRIYTAGFSGGSRTAMLIALKSQKIAGIIAYGAGLPPSEKYNASQIKGFDYIGLIGKKDFNLPEMLLLEKKLQHAGLNAKLLISELAHQLPDKQSIMEAVEWMELNAMKKNLCQRNDSFINSFFNKQIQAYNYLEKEGDLSETAQVLKYLIHDFSDYKDISPYKTRYDSILNLKEYANRLRELDRIYEYEQQLAEEFYKKSADISRSGVFPDSAFNWWILEIDKFNKQKKHRDPDKQFMAWRSLGNIFNFLIEIGDGFYQRKKYLPAIKCFKLCNLAIPDNRYALYMLASAQAFNKNNNAACKSIEKLIALGFKNKKLLEKNPAFQQLKENKKFISFLSNID